ncbi:MAG: terminase small subunit [Nitrospira sp.]
MPSDTTALPLSLKQEAFCLAVFGGQNPSKAYRNVFKPKQAKAKTIHEMASRLMAKRKVRTRLAELMQPVIQRARLTREQWLEGLVRMIIADPRKMFDAHGNPLEITELGENEAAAIAGFEFYEDFEGKGESRKAVGYTKKFKLIDRLRALELYGKAQCYYADKMVLTDPNGNPTEINNHITVEFVEASHPTAGISEGTNSLRDLHVPDR